MARVGIFCLPMPSHVNLFLALAQELMARGHLVTFFGISSNAERIRERGFLFELLEPDSVPHGTLDRMMRDMSSLGNVGSMRMQGRFDELRYEGILSKGPAMVKRAQLDALVVDQAEACSGSVADVTGLPWISVCSGLCLNSEKHVPPFFSPWAYSEKLGAVVRNRLAYAALEIASINTKQLINRYRRMWHLAPLTRFDDFFSRFAQISQQIREFDFIRRNLPDYFHYVGPISPRVTRVVEFPWSRLDGRPLIYASLGTLLNRHGRLYETILRACKAIDAQLVLSMGGSGRTHPTDDVTGNPIIVNYAPQRELLSRACIAITHAGLNSTLEGLSEGVPLVAIPISFEQPGIAARIRWTGAGDFIPSSKVTADGLQRMIVKVMNEASHREAARRIGSAIAQSGGAREATRIIEEVMRLGKPVLAARAM